MNESADFWRYDIGVNVIPADTVNKKPLVSWYEWQDKPIPEQMHNQWKEQGVFLQGIAIIPGRVWHREDKKDQYFTFLDADKQKAIDELCSRNGKATTLQEMSQKFIVEQHKDNLQKAHIYFYSPMPFPKKSSDSVLGLEVKGLGEHGIAYCANSMHKDGQPYKIIGTTNPIVLTADQANEYIERIDEMCKRYDLEYLEKHYRNLLDSDTIIHIGERHRSLIRLANSLLFKYGGNRNVAADGLDPLLEQQLKDKLVAINEKRCDPLPLPQSELNQIWKDAVNYYLRQPKSERNGNGNGKAFKSSSNNNGLELEPEVVAALEQVLDSKIPDKDYAECVIKTLKKTVKQEDSLVRQICYTGLSAYTNDPINLGIIAPTSEGKTYPVIESIKLFPKEDVWLIGKMSTKMLVRQKGTLVDENNEPLKPKIKELKKEIENVKKNKDKDKDYDRQEELNERLVSLFENARTLIDLRGKILVFLEPPEHELWNLLKPILSHDSEEIEFPFVDKTERGFEVKRVVVKGWPACIFCSAKDESNWSTWPEIVSRSLITSPNMNPEKYRESNLLIAQRKGLPRLIQQRVIVSDEEISLAKLCILNLKQQIRNYSSNNNPVWIPFLEILAEALPAEKGPDNRITKRIFSFLEIIVLAKSHLRKKLILGSETQAIAALEDLSQVLYITQNVSGMPSYKLKFFKDYFVPLVESKPEVNSETDTKGNVIKEKIIGVTTRELCEYYKQETGKSITTDAMKKIYLNELLNNGYIDEEDSLIDKRQKIYHHIVIFLLLTPKKYLITRIQSKSIILCNIPN
jgi:hypothetical protein